MSVKKRINELLEKIIENGNKSQIKLLLHRYHEADIAEALEMLPYQLKEQFFNKISRSEGAVVLEELSMDAQIELMENFKLDTAAQIVEKMDKDDAVDLLEALLDQESEKAEDIINRLELSDQIQLKRLLSYQENTAGGLMTTDYVSIPELLTIKDAIKHYQDISPTNNDSAFYLFIVNEYQQIKGVTSIRDLLLTDSNERIKNIRNNYPIKVHVDTDQEVVAQMFQKYHSLVLPVVDDLDVLLGVITVDDIVNVVVEEANEDIYKLSGTTGEDIVSEKLLFGNIFYSIGHRLPWLCVSILGGILASAIMIYYSDKLVYASSILPLTLVLSFVPLLIGLGGNIGNQSATIVVRALATTDIESEHSLYTVFRETSIGLIIGAIIGISVGLFVWLVNSDIILAICIGVTILLNMGVASFIGAILPLILRSIKIDPAIASAPFISTTLDVIGQIIYFSIALLLANIFL